MIVLLLITVFMGMQIKNLKWSFDLANIVPDDDEDMIYFRQFRETFGEDGNMMAFGFRDSAIYEIGAFQAFSKLTNSIASKEGITSVVGVPNLQKIEKDAKSGSFIPRDIFEEVPESQQELDSLLREVAKLRMYSGKLWNPSSGATLLLISIDKEVLNSKERDILIPDVLAEAETFKNETGIDLRIAGLPYLRVTNTARAKSELIMFTVLSLVVTGIILFLFFRSFKAVIFPIVIIGIVVVWVLGTLALLQYKITILTGLIPPIIVVIGIPNSVYMLNKYHQEYLSHGDQMKALRRIIRKIGVVTLITNLTTAVGFLVLISTQIKILVEFGIVAGINIMATFIVSIIMIPAVFSLYKPPSQKHLKHLDFKIMDKVLTLIDYFVHKFRPAVFVITVGVVVVSAIGLSRIEAVSFMVDDLPEDDVVRKDLRFFERNFSGIMPLEVIIDTGGKRGVQNIRNLRKIEQLEKYLSSIEFISEPTSVVRFAKAARQAFYNQNEAFYSLPNSRDLGFIMKYLSTGELEDVSKTFIDSTGQFTRVSYLIADVGSVKLDSLVNQVVQPQIDSLFQNTKMSAKLTGTTLIFIKGNKFLIKNLLTSMVIAFMIIAVIMGLLFKNFKMIVISVIPNMIPLLITAGLMGYFGIPLKPSTALVFSIAFGISIDNSIHLLAKYRQELYIHKFNVSKAISVSIRETGSSMIYTAIILFFGFIIFTLSEFGGTIALGKLTAITLFVAMLTNVVLLPALIMQFDSGKRSSKSHPLIESVPELAEGIDDDPEDSSK